MSNPPLWKASVALSKAEVHDAAAVFEITPPAPQAVLIAEDPFEDEALVEALYSEAVDANFLSGVMGRKVIVAPLPDQDWIKLSQEGLPPVRAGRFFVYGAHDAGRVPCGVVPLKIEAGLAFGTGHHETTALCLAALSDLSKRKRFKNILDLGCGTGLLAIGAIKLWHSPVQATDIDMAAVRVTIDNARTNGVAPYLRSFMADGLVHPALSAAAPFDLIVANILASPLTRLAPQIARVTTSGSMILLSGLLRWQEKMVLSFYHPFGFVTRQIRRDGPWSALLLERPRRRG